MAGLILVIAVLPAEYGVDPLGIGRRLGLTAMSDVAKQVEALAADRASRGGGGTPTIAPQDRAFQQETVEFKIAPGAFVEYKYRLEKGEALLYSWKATGPVNCDLHAEPDGAPQGYAESYEKKDRISQGVGHADGALLRHSRLVLGESRRCRSDRHARQCRLFQPLARIPRGAAGEEQDLPVTIELRRARAKWDAP